MGHFLITFEISSNRAHRQTILQYKIITKENNAFTNPLD